MKNSTWLAVLIGLLPAWFCCANEPRVDFNREIRPILSDKCFVCHGPNEADRQANLRLDQKESALGESESGAIPIVPGKPDESEVVSRITSSDDDLRMPPPDSSKSLTPEEIELIRTWIAEGGEWEDHWSFRAPQRPTVPAVQASPWAKNPIDRFILARL